MKKTKLLLPLLGVAATAGAIVPLAVSCNKGEDPVPPGPTPDPEVEVKVTEPTKKEAKVENKPTATGYNTVVTFAGFSVTGVDSLDKLEVEIGCDSWLVSDYKTKAELVQAKTTNDDAINFDVVITCEDDGWIVADKYVVYMAIFLKEGHKPLLASGEYTATIKLEVVTPAPGTYTEEGIEDSFLGFDYAYADFENFFILHWDDNALSDYVPVLYGTDAETPIDSAVATAEFTRSDVDGGMVLTVYDVRADRSTDLKFTLGCEYWSLGEKVQDLFKPSTGVQFVIDWTE